MVNGRQIAIQGGIFKTAKLCHEWLEDLDSPTTFIEELGRSGIKADFFTFWQRLPEVEPRYSYYHEKDAVAAVPLHTYEHWWSKQIGSKTRNLVRKAQKSGVNVRVASFDQQLVQGITEIFNETPTRQGRRFLHFGKNETQVKSEMARRLDRSVFIGAFMRDELIGFIKLLDAGKYWMAVEILSKIAHRDKSPQNALLDFAVRYCCERRTPYLVYSRWISSSLGDFKRRNGFEKFELPRYVVPLSLKGKFLLGSNLYPFLAKPFLPIRLRQIGKGLRLNFYSLLSKRHL
jgi:hypothetical protein